MQSSNMSLRTLFRGAIHVIRFFQMANLSFTTYTICYAAWLRSQEYRNVIKYHDVSNQTFLDMKEAAMIIACAALGIEVFINSDFNKPSDPRLSIMSLAAYSMGLCFYATMPAARQYLTHNGVLTDPGNYVDFSKLDTALWRTSLAYGMVTWYVSLFLGDMGVKTSDYCCSGPRAWCSYCPQLWIEQKEPFYRSLA
ncbi:uncharacterized protein CCOS01_08498 [Colletotrichum costaricense]|uniref:Uncharacterized protein n=1 Tax=Colletotrichum costaricense TaxID=1209916 RepID=A0AAI9YWK2_9PEZI|nr:uncharacterized protein CCOS01_08498 [Colletotrichum costaricense]KAK1526080.1 hypothetical protein CCOS01_08498 [Colletotrichum costaricense]